MVEGVNELPEKIHDVFGKLLHILSEHEARLNKLEERLLIPAGQVDAENTRLKKEWEESDFIGLSLEQKETLVYLLRKQSSFYTEQIAVGVGLPKEKVSRAVNGLIQKQSPHPNKKVIYEEILERGSSALKCGDK